MEPVVEVCTFDTKRTARLKEKPVFKKEVNHRMKVLLDNLPMSLDINKLDIEEYFKKFAIISTYPKARIKVKQAVALLANDLFPPPVIKEYLNSKFKVVNIHNVRFYCDLVIERKETNNQAKED